MIEGNILLGIQTDLGQIKREQASQGIRLSAIEYHMCGNLTSLYGIQSDVADLKLRVDRIERRLRLSEAEH